MLLSPYDGMLPDSGLLAGPAGYAPGQRALLDVIAGGEAQSYNTRFNGNGPSATFDSYDDHPRQLVPIPWMRGYKSDAAGRYQFISTTWDKLKNQLGLTDFTPPNQDAAAWQNAQNAFSARYPGQDLSAALAARQYGPVASALGSEWASIQRDPQSFINRLQAGST